LRISPEESSHVKLNRTRQLPDGRPLAEPRQREIDQQVFSPSLTNGLPFCLASDASYQGEAPLQRAKRCDHLRAPRELVLRWQAAKIRDRRHERFEQLAVFLESQLRNSLTRCRRLAPVTISEELLLERFVPEDVEDAERCRDRLSLQLGFQECLELAL